MSENQYITLSPEADRIRRQLSDRAGVNIALCRAMDVENARTVGHIQKDYLSERGPMTLGVISNRLRGSIRASLAYSQGDAIQSGIGSNVVYAAAHEFGFDGEVPVKEHTRRNSLGDRFKVGGAVVDRFSALRLGALSKHQVSQRVQDSGKYTLAKRGAKQVATGERGTVKAHTMHMKQKARHYTFNGIKDRLDRYGAAFSEAILKLWKEGTR